MKYLLKLMACGTVICCIACEVSAMDNNATTDIDRTVGDVVPPEMRDNLHPDISRLPVPPAPTYRPIQHQANVNQLGSTWQNVNQTVNRLHMGQMSRDEFLRLQQHHAPNDFTDAMAERRLAITESSSDDDDFDSTKSSTQNTQQNTTTSQSPIQKGFTTADWKELAEQARLSSSDDDPASDNEPW